MLNFFIQEKYINLLSGFLERFKKDGSNFVFRCPLCGDSQKNKFKTRGYFYKKGQGYNFYCHNCNESMSFEKFLSIINPTLYDDAKRESLAEFLSTKKPKKKEHKPEDFKPLIVDNKKLISVSSLSENHVAVKYLSGRLLPREMMKRVFWTENFKDLTNSLVGDKYKERYIPEEGIVFVQKDKDLNVVGYQLRDISEGIPKHRRFINVRMEGKRGFFGIDELDTSKRHYVVEGCMDSLFIPNSVAVMNASLKSAELENAIYFQDQEPRNTEVTKHLHDLIKNKYSVVLLPKQFTGMDVNDIVKNGYDTKKLLDLFDKNTYKGLTAEMKFLKWKRGLL